jgi:hypothetical protein
MRFTVFRTVGWAEPKAKPMLILGKQHALHFVQRILRVRGQ